MTYVRNIWYAAAWADEVAPGALFHRTYLEEPVLIYRLEDGTPVAMSNRCPHRFAPLHLGKLDGETVECPYHGLAFASDGRCVHNPHGSGFVPSAARVQTFPIVEKHEVLWIWMGDPKLADADRIVDYNYLTDHVKWTIIRGYMNLKANYEIVIDNLTDLSHAPILHPVLEHRDVSRGKFKLTRDGDTAKTHNWVPGTVPPPFFEMLPQTQAIKDEHGLVDHWQDMEYAPPGCMNTLYGITRRGAPREEGLMTLNPNLVTPETSSSSHYFYAGVRNFGLGDERMSEAFRVAYAHAFEHEDRPMVEGVQAMMGSRTLDEMKPILLVNDGASVHARRVLQRMREDETASPARGRAAEPAIALEMR